MKSKNLFSSTAFNFHPFSSSSNLNFAYFSKSTFLRYENSNDFNILSTSDCSILVPETMVFTTAVPKKVLSPKIINLRWVFSSLENSSIVES